MGVFLTILKILGIILASLLALIIVLILLVLYAPVRYKLKGAYNGDADGKVKVRWLFAGVQSDIVKNDEVGMSVLVKIKFFGIPIKKMQVLGGDKKDDSGGKAKKSKKEKVKKKKLKKDKNTDQQITVIDPGAPELDDVPTGGDANSIAVQSDGNVQNTGSVGSGASDSVSGTDVINTVTGDNVISGNSDVNGPATNDPVLNEPSIDEFSDIDDLLDESQLSEKERKKAEKKRKKAEKKAAKEAKKAAKKAAADAEGEDSGKKNIADRIDVIYDKAESVLDKVSEKTEMVRTKKNHIIEFFDRPYVQNTIKRGKKVLRRLFKNLLPRKGDVNLLLGLKNPASTGQIVGKVSMFYPYYYRWLHLTPEFHEQKIEADMWCKGRIHLGSFAIPALFLYLSKDFKKTMNLAKKI